ncbi:MAG: HXXEE domain-containing protein [Acidobacteriota bacterium]
MAETLGSVVIATSGLSLALLVALGLASTRRFGVIVGRRDRLAIQRLFRIAIVVQGAHFLEELLTGFAVWFPAVLGQAPWSTEFFVIFNLAWLFIWLAAAAALPTGRRWPLAPLWFLALALAGNGVVHPLLALRAGGYFPGLLTSPLTGLAGFLLITRLLRSTGPGAGP